MNIYICNLSYNNKQVTMVFISIDPNIIYFTHSKIKKCFSTGKLIDETYHEIKTGKTKISDIPLITIYCIDGKYYSLNNRRLYLFKMLKKDGTIEKIVAIQKEIPSKKIADRFVKNSYSLVAKMSLL